MDPLTISVLNLSEAEYNLLLRRFRDQPRKQELLAAVREEGSYHVDYNELSDRLGYGAKKSALYTLKHRLTKDLVDFRLNAEKNEFILTKERIQSLRSLLYSKDHPILEKETKDLLRKCQQLDVIRGVFEIHFCDYLLNYHHMNTRRRIRQQMEESLEKERIFCLIEIEFYRIVFEFQDLFYQARITPPGIHREELNQAEIYHGDLNMRISEFIVLSVQMTFDLRLAASSDQLSQLSEKIQRLYELYLNSNVQFRFPNCNFAIECLFNKYHLITGNEIEFRQSLKRLDSEVASVIGYKTYEDVLFYYLFAKVYAMSKSDRSTVLRTYLEKTFPDKELPRYSERFNYYLNHLLAISLLCEGNVRKSEGRLLKARSYTKYLEEPAIWIEIENALLKLSIHVSKREDEMAAYELGLLKRLIRREGIQKELFSPFIRYTQKHIQAPIRLYIDYREQLKELQLKTGLLQLVDFDDILK
jgi:hypothetical protein